MLYSSRTSAMFTVTSFSIPWMLKRLPPYSGMSESTSTTSAPSESRRRARLLPMKPRPPVMSTRSPSYKLGMCSPIRVGTQTAMVLDHRLRHFVDREVEPSQVLSEEPEDEELGSSEQHCDDREEGPARRQCASREDLAEDVDGSDAGADDQTKAEQGADV